MGKPRVRRGFGRVEKRPSGRYRAAYTGPDGQLYRAPMTFGARDDAIAWLSARRAEIEMQVWAPEVAARGAASRTVPALRAYADVWLETRKTKGRELRPTTRRQYRMLLDKFIYPTFGDERIDRISHEDVNAWYDALAPRPRDDPGPVVQPAAHDLRQRRLGAAPSVDPLQPGPHPRRRKHQAGSPRPSPPRSKSFRRSSRSCPTATSSWHCWRRGARCASASSPSSAAATSICAQTG